MSNRQRWRWTGPRLSAGGFTRLCHYQAVCGASLLAVGLVGCFDSGPAPTFQVSGTVKFSDGQPLAGGQILLRPDNDSKYSARGEIDTEGAFQVSTFKKGDGAIAGTHRVMITPHVDRELLDQPASARRRTKPILDARYQDLSRSPLEVTVVSDGSSDNHFDIVVEPPSPRRGRKR